MTAFTINYKNGIWYTSLPRSAEAAAQQLKDKGWKFHWTMHNDRCYVKCGGCAAGIPDYTRFTWLAERAAPFREHFSPEAEAAFQQAKSSEKVERSKTEDTVKKSFATDDAGVTIQTPAPPGMVYRPYQRAGIQWIVERKGVLLADPPGLGKTIQVLGAINYLPEIKEVLVVAPSALAALWVREANLWIDRPLNAVFVKDSLDLPPLAKDGEVNLLAMTYDRVPKTLGADIGEVLSKKSKVQTDSRGLRRALQKVFNRPLLRRILVVSNGQPVDWSAAMSSRLADTIGQPRIFVCEDADDLGNAQEWIAENPQALAVVVIAPPPGAVALAAMTEGENPYEQMYRLARSFKMPGQRASTTRNQPSGYDLVVKDKLYTIRTMGRGLGLVDDLMQRPIDMLVLDEAHVVNNPKNETSIGIFGEEDRRGTKVKRGLSDIAKRLVYLTGTPLRNKTCELWGMLHSLAPVTFKNFFRFGKEFCDAYETKWGWNFDGKSNQDVLDTKLRGGTEHNGLMIRRKKEDVLKDLPPKTRIVLPLEPPEEAEWLIAEQWGEAGNIDAEMDLLEAQAMIAEIEGNDPEYASAVASLTKARDVAFDEMAAQRVEIGRYKVKQAIEFIEGLRDGGVDKVGIFATHHVVVDGLTEGLRKGGKVAIIDGRVAGKGRVVPVTGEPEVIDRIKVVDAFQTDPEVKFFIGNYKAAKEGWTLTAASTVVMVESTWTAADNEQAEDRFHRIGTVNPVTIYYLVFDGSLDQKVLDAVVRKMETAFEVLDKPQGLRPSKLSNVEAIKLNDTFVSKPEVPARTGREVAPKTYTEAQRKAAQEAIQMIASVCDGARKQDCQGFSGSWVEAGHWLARQAEFDDRKTQIAVRAITKFQRQVPEHLLEILGIRKRGQAAEPPVRYRLVRKGKTWYVEMTTTLVEQPVQRKARWKVTSSNGDLAEGTILTKTESAFTWEGGEATIDDQSEELVEELGIPEPTKSKKPVRWKNGYWQRELADGWKDFEPKWIDDPSQAVPMSREVPKAPSKRPSPKAPSPAKAPSPRAPSPKAPSNRPSLVPEVSMPTGLEAADGTDDSAQIIAAIDKYISIGDRRINYSSMRPGLYINYYNLPKGSGGDRAEAENNRFALLIRPKGDKYSVETSVSALDRKWTLRGKTATLDKLGKYIADHLNKISKDVPPKWTHTHLEAPEGYSPKAPSKRPSPAKAPIRLHIKDPDAFKKLVELEGAEWGRIQEERGVKLANSFFLNELVFKVLEQQGLVSPDIPLSDLDPDAGVIVGHAGAVYIVMPDGEIMLDGASITGEKQAMAERFMQVIEAEE